MPSILIVDDDPQLTQMLSLALSHNGFTVDVAHASHAAMEFVQKKKYELIMQDVFFPNKDDGFAVMQNYYPMARDNKTPIILMTSMPLELIQQEFELDRYLSIATMFISKSDDINEIVNKVKEVISQQNAPA